MKAAIIGSRNLKVDISQYVPENVTEIISGGAKGIDTQAEIYADYMNIPKLILKPNYDGYGKAAPVKRNEKIAEISDIIIAIWDGKSRGTKYLIDYARKIGKSIEVHIISGN